VTRSLSNQSKEVSRAKIRAASEEPSGDKYPCGLSRTHVGFKADMSCIAKGYWLVLNSVLLLDILPLCRGTNNTSFSCYRNDPSSNIKSQGEKWLSTGKMVFSLLFIVIFHL